MEIESQGSDGLLIHVPRFKTDVTREADVIEEVMRIYGYNNVEVSKAISYTATNENKNYNLDLENKLSNALEGFGFNEMMSLSLTKESYYTEHDKNVKVVNPLSADLNVMRADMLYSGLESIAYNINRKNSNLKLFEIGKTYHLTNDEKNKYQEQKHLSVFISGSLFNANPYGLAQKANFSFIKATIENILQKIGIKNYKSLESSYRNFDLGLTYALNNNTLVEFGLVNNTQLKKFDIEQPVYYACFNWSVLLKAFSKQKIEFEEISKFPSVKRDLALLLDKSIKFQQIEELGFGSERKFIKEINLFDIYEGEKLGNKKSYAVSFTMMNNEATLTDKQIEGVMEKLIATYKEKLGAELR